MIWVTDVRVCWSIGSENLKVWTWTWNYFNFLKRVNFSKTHLNFTTKFVIYFFVIVSVNANFDITKAHFNSFTTNFAIKWKFCVCDSLSVQTKDFARWQDTNEIISCLSCVCFNNIKIICWVNWQLSFKFYWSTTTSNSKMFD